MARPLPDTVKVWSPEGIPQTHTLPNANDLCRRGWTRYDPATPPKEIAAKITSLAPPVVTPPPVDTKLTELREKAAGIGLRFESTWGINRLQTAIAEKLSQRNSKVQRAQAKQESDSEIPPDVKLMMELTARQAAEDAQDEA